MLKHFFDCDAYPAVDTVFANQVVANLAVAAKVRRIAERLKTDGELAMLAFERIAPMRAVWADGFEKPRRFTVSQRHGVIPRNTVQFRPMRCKTGIARGKPARCRWLPAKSAFGFLEPLSIAANYADLD